MSLEDCTPMPLIVIDSVMVKELVGLGEELKIENYTTEVYQDYVCTQTNSTYGTHIGCMEIEIIFCVPSSSLPGVGVAL